MRNGKKLLSSKDVEAAIFESLLLSPLNDVIFVFQMSQNKTALLSSI